MLYIQHLKYIVISKDDFRHLKIQPVYCQAIQPVIYILDYEKKQLCCYILVSVRNMLLKATILVNYCILISLVESEKDVKKAVDFCIKNWSMLEHSSININCSI